MFKKLIFAVLVTLSSISLFGQDYYGHIDNQLIVKFKKNVLNDDSSDYQDLFKKSRLYELHQLLNVEAYKLIGSRKFKNSYLITYDNELFSVEQAIVLYETSNMFEFVEPNEIYKGDGYFETIPNDSNFSLQWWMINDGSFSIIPSTADADIDMELAWDIQKGDPSLIIAILDSGVKLDHPEFAGRLWINSLEENDGTDTDGNGYINDLNGGWDFVGDDNTPTDTHGHGTNMTGILAATGNNSSGYAGVNWFSKLMICRILNSNNTGSTSDLASAIYYAVDNGAKVINISAAGGSSSSVLNACNYASSNQVIVVASMGNNNFGTPLYPAAYPTTIAVGASNPDDTRSAPFMFTTGTGSNYGNHIDVIAPGNFIYSLNHQSNTQSAVGGGTSSAAPLVSGLASLLLSENPQLTIEEVRTIIRESAEDQVGDPTEDTVGWDIYFGFGRINAKNALTHSLLNINEFSNFGHNIKIYPNPINSESLILNIDNLPIGNYKVKIFNLLGQVEFDSGLTNNALSVELIMPKLSQGSYIVKFIDNVTSQSISKKLIVY